MSKTPSHIIQRQCIELQMPTRLPHLQIQDDAIALFKEVLRDRIGECLDRLFPGEELVRLDTLVIDLGRIPAAAWEAEFVARFVEEFELVLQGAQKAHVVEAAARDMASRPAVQAAEASGERGPWAALSYFLAHGFLPWWHLAQDKSSIQDLVKALLGQGQEIPPSLLLRMQETFAAPTALQRLVHALPDTQLSALAKAMGRLSPQAEAAMGALTRLLTLPAHGISRTEARIAVWQEILGGAPAPEPLLPEDVLAAAIAQLAESTEQTPEALLQVVASDDPQLSGAWLRDLAQVQARLAAHPTQANARLHAPALRRAAEALQSWLQQADAQQFDLDKALSLLRDLQAALSPGELRDALAQVIAQLNAARRQRPAAPLHVPPTSELQRLAHAMREEASHCPAPLLLAIQEFYLKFSLLHAPEMQASLLAAPLQHLALEIMRLRASAGTSSQGPYLQAAARQLLDVLDAQTLAAQQLALAGAAPLMVEERQDVEALTGDEKRTPLADKALHDTESATLDSAALAVSQRNTAAVLPAPSVPATQAHASAWIATQIAILARTELAAPTSLNLATWRTWFKALRSPEVRPLLAHARWRDLLQAISELLGGQSPALQLRSILQLADVLLAAGPTPQLPPSTPATLRAALEELVQIGDAAGSPKEVAQVQARLRAIAGVLQDSAAAQGDQVESDAPTADLSWKAAWLPLKASLQALATFGRPTLLAAGINPAQVDGLSALLGQAHPERGERQLARILGQLLDMAAQVQGLQRDAVLNAQMDRQTNSLPTTDVNAQVLESVQRRAALVLRDVPGSQAANPSPIHGQQQMPALEAISPAVQQRLTRFLNALIALAAGMEGELRQTSAPTKSPVRKQEWQVEWEALRTWITMPDNDAPATESDSAHEAVEIAAAMLVRDAAGMAHGKPSFWKSPRAEKETIVEADAAEALDNTTDSESDAANPSRIDDHGWKRLYPKKASSLESLLVGEEAFVGADPATLGAFQSEIHREISHPETDLPVLHWQPGAAYLYRLGQVDATASSTPFIHPPTHTPETGVLPHTVRSRHLLPAAQASAETRSAAADRLLTAPHHAIQSAEVLVSLAEMLAPALEEGLLTDAQLAFWQAAPVQMLAGLVAGLRTGRLLRSEVAALGKQLEAAGMLAFAPVSDTAHGKSSAGKSRLDLLDMASTALQGDLDTAHSRQLEAADSSHAPALSPALELATASSHRKNQDPNDLDAAQNRDLNTSDSPAAAEEPHLAGSYFEPPVFRCLLWERDFGQVKAIDHLPISAEQTSADSARQKNAGHLVGLPGFETRYLRPYIWLSPTELRRAAQQAQVDHVLLLLSTLVTQLQAQADGQESIALSTFAQIRLWMQQFPGQSLPKSLGRRLADALVVLRASAAPTVWASPSPASETPAISADKGHAAAVQVVRAQQLPQPAAQQPDVQASPSIAALLPAPRPQWRTKVERLAAAPFVHQLIGPRPIAILPQEVFQARRTQLIASIQALLQLQAPVQGLRRTLEPLTRQHKPAPAAPSLSDASRQQLAQAAQQAKTLLREPLPARLHAALRSLQSGLTGHSQSLPDLKAIQRISNQANALLQGNKGKSAPREPEKELSIYVKNAGLVLLWPFIQRFFQNLGLVEGREFVSPAAHGRAVLFLQYLADPDPETAEHLLPLCKLLCGYPDDRPIALALAPTEEEIEQCEGLLATVPSHHPAMKNMRIDGFRTAWLQREGALKPRGDHHLLHVEKQAYDVLLEQLPWSIRVIRLPWMHTAILTEW